MGSGPALWVNRLFRGFFPTRADRDEADSPTVAVVTRISYHLELDATCWRLRFRSAIGVSEHGVAVDGGLAALLAGVAAGERPRKRHQMRNAAAILAVFANAPLRNASAQLVFGETLLWLQGEWVIRTAIQKTETSRPEIFRFPLHREAGRFIDALILGDSSAAMLPVLREKVEQSKRQLFVLPDGAPAAATYVPRIFRSLTGNSFTTLRVMLYSDAITDHGVMGIDLAKPAAHHASTRIVKQCYMTEQVAETHADNFCRRRRHRIRKDRQDYGDLMSNLRKIHTWKCRVVMGNSIRYRARIPNGLVK